MFCSFGIIMKIFYFILNSFNFRIFHKFDKIVIAESKRFELLIPFGIHAFQACALDRYANSPKNIDMITYFYIFFNTNYIIFLITSINCFIFFKSPSLTFIFFKSLKFACNISFLRFIIPLSIFIILVIETFFVFKQS